MKIKIECICIIYNYICSLCLRRKSPPFFSFVSLHYRSAITLLRGGWWCVVTGHWRETEFSASWVTTTGVTGTTAPRWKASLTTSRRGLKTSAPTSARYKSLKTRRENVYSFWQKVVKSLTSITSNGNKASKYLRINKVSGMRVSVTSSSAAACKNLAFLNNLSFLLYTHPILEVYIHVNTLYSAIKMLFC